jgi:hypothetical protein
MPISELGIKNKETLIVEQNQELVAKFKEETKKEILNS